MFKSKTMIYPVSKIKELYIYTTHSLSIDEGDDKFEHYTQVLHKFHTYR